MCFLEIGELGTCGAVECGVVEGHGVFELEIWLGVGFSGLCHSLWCDGEEQRQRLYVVSH